jgi:Tir chaperone family protein CesT
MLTREDLESYLLRMEDLESDELEEGMYLVRSRAGAPPVVVNYSPPLLLLRMTVMDLPKPALKNPQLLRTLLELNASDMVHGAYGLEEEELILSDTLELETLDFIELQASIESMQLAASGHIEQIRKLAGANGGGGAS